MQNRTNSIANRPSVVRAVFASATFLLLAPAGRAQMVPRRVAVVNFELGEQARQVTHQSLGIQGDAGVDLANELVTELGASGKVALIERAELARVMKEANIPLDEHFDPANAVKLGKLSGAQSVLVGSVTSLSGGLHATSLSTICRFTPSRCPAQAQQTKGEVAITVSVRVVDVETGRIRTTATGEGKASETKTFAAGSKEVEYGNHLLNDAAKQAFAKVVAQLDSSPDLAPVAPPAPRTAYSADVVDVTGDQITVMMGIKEGAHVGDLLDITRAGKTLRDRNGKTVTLKEKVGTAKVTSVEDQVTYATFTPAGTASVKKDDTASWKP